MRITRFKITNKEAPKVGLKEIDLTKKELGAVVALAGKNGSGKSRILSFVARYHKNISSLDFLNGHFSGIPEYMLEPFIPALDSAKTMLKKVEEKSNDTILQMVEGNIRPLLESFSKLTDSYVKVVDTDNLKIVQEKVDERYLSFENIVNSGRHTLNLSNLLNQKNFPNEFESLNSLSTIKYLNSLCDKILTSEFHIYTKNRNNPLLVSDELRSQNLFKKLEILQGHIKSLLGKDFNYINISQDNVIKSQLILDGRAFDLHLLSPGQKTLFAYALLLFFLDINSKTNLGESIIIIDEPEKHLHPEAQIILIDALRKIVSKNGQLWIATHSIHILSILDSNEIFLVKDDGIVAPSRLTPGKSINELIGLEEYRLKFASFINSISDWAYANFMVQCFKEPNVVFSNNKNDPQFKIFKSFVLERKTIQLLDFGAGKGRIGSTINEDAEVKERIEYSAFEPNEELVPYLKQIDNIKGIFTKVEEVPREKFDCVLLCNVLHEISPRDWVDCLLNIKEILNESGSLLIIEDKFLPQGERANEFGYLILGSEETNVLLGAEGIELKLNEVEFKDRICFTVHKKEQINPTRDNVLDALRLLEKNSFERIKKLKEIKNPDLSTGRLYANISQLYINSRLAVDILGAQ